MELLLLLLSIQSGDRMHGARLVQHMPLMPPFIAATVNDVGAKLSVTDRVKERDTE